MSMYNLGILGGMGPEATAYFYDLLLKKYKVKNDQNHISCVIITNSKIPDRTSYIKGIGPSPFNEIVKSLQQLKSLSEKILITCNTAHYFQEDYKRILGDKFLSIVDIACRYIEKEKPLSKVVVLGTEGTKIARIFNSNEVEFVYPINEVQNKIDKLIYNIKQSDKTLEDFSGDLQKIMVENFEVNSLFLLGCTELSMLKKFLNIDTIDPIELAIEKVVEIFENKCINVCN